jgi:asparagine synthase (glutamine-hydrolysing)
VCGISGIASIGAADPGAVRAMSAALAHRGPDAHGEAVLGPVALDARRLAIIDLEHGNQPIATEDDAVTVVQNGEIYNHAALRRELEAQGHRFRTRCDTEVIGHLYEQHGLAAFARLRGMFAIALWDARGRRLVLARDRFGIKPLFHARLRDGSLAFASELSALALAPGFSGELDVAALEAYLALNSIPAPMTAYAAARKLPAGHWLTWDSVTGRTETARWCRPRPAGELRAEPLDVLAVELRERLRDSVRAHLVADVPVGVLLSGGIDSSALTALASREGAHPVQTFSIGFRERSFDELDRARLVARRYGTDHHELIVQSAHAAQLLPEIAAASDEPLGDSSALPTYVVSRLAAGRVKVVLSGEGGDELFGGYETYVADLLAARIGRAARLLSPLAERMPSGDRRVPLDKIDRMSMAHSLEARVPFLDAHVAELALALRTRDKVRGLAKKRVLRRAVAPLVPREIVHGRKRGFSIPAAAWLRGPLLPLARDILSPARLAGQGVLDATAAARLLERHAAGAQDFSRQLWGLMSLSLWLDRRPGSSC